MTDHPRRWKIPVAPGLTYCATATTSAPIEWMPIIEWDREKVIPVIEEVLLLSLRDESPSIADDARAIFDALDTSGGER